MSQAAPQMSTTIRAMTHSTVPMAMAATPLSSRVRSAGSLSMRSGVNGGRASMRAGYRRLPRVGVWTTVLDVS